MLDSLNNQQLAIVVVVLCLLIWAAGTAFTRWVEGRAIPPRDRASVRIPDDELALLGEDWRERVPFFPNLTLPPGAKVTTFQDMITIELDEPTEVTKRIAERPPLVNPWGVDRYRLYGTVTGRMNPDGTLDHEEWSR